MLLYIRKDFDRELKIFKFKYLPSTYLHISLIKCFDNYNFIKKTNNNTLFDPTYRYKDTDQISNLMI